MILINDDHDCDDHDQNDHDHDHDDVDDCYDDGGGDNEKIMIMDDCWEEKENALCLQECPLLTYCHQ